MRPECRLKAGEGWEEVERHRNASHTWFSSRLPLDAWKSQLWRDYPSNIDSITCWKHLDNQMSTNLNSSEKKMDLSETHLRLKVAIGRCISDLRWHWPRILLDDKQRSKEQLKPRERESSQLTLSDHLHSWPQVAAWSSADFGFKFKMHAILDP